MRNILPAVIEDENMTFVTQNKYLNYLGTGFSTTRQELRFYYSLIVSKETLLPLTLLQRKKGSEDLNRTDFTGINMNPVPPTENSWYYSSYLKTYKPEKQQQLVMIKPGQKAPDFSLTNKVTGLSEELSKYSGQVILLEFWIKNCGYCMEAVPKLNALNKKCKSLSLKILGVNTEDDEQSIEVFMKKNRVEHPIL